MVSVDTTQLSNESPLPPRPKLIHSLSDVALLAAVPGLFASVAVVMFWLGHILPGALAALLSLVAFGVCLYPMILRRDEEDRYRNDRMFQEGQLP